MRSRRRAQATNVLLTPVAPMRGKDLSAGKRVKAEFTVALVKWISLK